MDEKEKQRCKDVIVPIYKQAMNRAINEKIDPFYAVTLLLDLSLHALFRVVDKKHLHEVKYDVDLAVKKHYERAMNDE